MYVADIPYLPHVERVVTLAIRFPHLTERISSETIIIAKDETN